MRYALLVLLIAGQVAAGAPPRLSNVWHSRSGKAIATVLAVTNFILATPVLTNPAETDPASPDVVLPTINEDWQQVTHDDKEHLKSSFYLVFDLGENWHTMHIEYIGVNKDGVPLFVGSRFLIILHGNDGSTQYAFDYTVPSLVGYAGLIKRNVKPKEVIVFQHPESDVYDITVLAIDDVNMSDYQPISIAHWPSAYTAIELLSYHQYSEENELDFFSYPAMRRDCLSGRFYSRAQLVKHSCFLPTDLNSIGSPIFIRESRELAAFHFANTDDNIPYAVHALPALVRFSSNITDSGKAQKVAVRWGAIKKRAP